MKKNLIYLLVALFATAFVACEKNDDQQDEPVPELSANMLIVGTQQYAINPTLSVSSEGFYLFDAHDPHNQYNIVIDISTSYVGQTVDLTQNPTSNLDYYINFETTDLEFALQSSLTQPIRTINGNGVDKVFSEGTLQLVSDNDTLVLRLSGTLSNGTYVGIMMKVAIDNIGATDNQIIYDGQVYTAGGVVRHNAGLLFPYWLECSGNECPIRISIEVQPNTIGNTINLASSTADFAYRLNLFIPDTTVTQSNYEGGEFTGEVTASYWDIPMQSSTNVNGSLFSSGTLTVGEDDVALTFNLSGVLACGHSVSTQIRIDKSDIEEIEI